MSLSTATPLAGDLSGPVGERERWGGRKETGHSRLRGDTDVGENRGHWRRWEVEIKECVKRMCRED